MLLASVLDSKSKEINGSIVMALVHVLGSPLTRVYLRPKADIMTMLQPMSDVFYPTGTDKLERVQCVQRCVITLCQDWTGLIALVDGGNKCGLRSLIEVLHVVDKDTSEPRLDLRAAALETIIAILRLANRSFFSAGGDPVGAGGLDFGSGAGGGGAVGRAASGGAGGGFGGGGSSGALHPAGMFAPDMDTSMKLRPRTRGPHNLLHNYMAALLVAFFHCGLVDSLVDLGRGPDRAVSVLATNLLDELLRLADHYLPARQCAQLHALPVLVDNATDSANPAQRARASTMLTNLQRVTRDTMGPSSNDGGGGGGSSSSSSAPPAPASSSTPSPMSDLQHQGYLAAMMSSGGLRRVKGLDRRQDLIDALKLKSDLQLDVSHVQLLIKESEIPATKDHTKWKWPVISELLGGALNNPEHLATCLKTKFFRRLLSFYRPSRQAFVDMPWAPKNMMTVRIGCAAIEVLLKNPAGVEFLSNHNFFLELIKILQIELKDEPQKESDRILTEIRVLNTMSREYFTMVGTLTSSEAGLRLLERVKVINTLYLLAKHKTRDDLCQLLISHLDYSVDGSTAPRAILADVLTSGTRASRLHATKHMRTLLRSGVAQFDKWGMTLLVHQLVDPDKAVSSAALSILEEACEEPRHLDAVIKLRPRVFDMEGAEPILLRFLSTPAGFAYLKEKEWVEARLDRWRHELSTKYAADLDTAFRRMLTGHDGSDDNSGAGGGGGGGGLRATRNNQPSTPISRSISSQGVAASPGPASDHGTGGDGAVPLNLHFYGELVRTEEGCSVLKRSGHLPEFLATVLDETADPLQRRAAAWSLGHIGGCDLGLQLLEAEGGAVAKLTNLAETAQHLALRGTLFCALGILTRTERGRAALEVCGWESPSDPHQLISVPRDPRTFLTIPPYAYQGSWPEHFSEDPRSTASSSGLAGVQAVPAAATAASSPTAARPTPAAPETSGPGGTAVDDEAALRMEALEKVLNLSNHIVQEANVKHLRRLRLAHPNLFLGNSEFLAQIYRAVEGYKFKLPARQFLHQIFEPTELCADHFGKKKGKAAGV